MYHAADSNDIKAVVECIYRELCLDPQTGIQTRRLVGVGVSLGASLLGLYVARAGDKCHLDAMVGIGSPFYYSRMEKFITNSFFGFYNLMLGSSLVQKGLPYYEQYDQMVSKPEKKLAERLRKNWTLIGITDIARDMAGFESTDDFVKEFDLQFHLQKIKIPTFFICSQDDFLFGPDTVPFQHCHENVLLGVTRYGGHICYLEGTWLPTEQWWMKPATDFVSFFIQKSVQKQAESQKRR